MHDDIGDDDEFDLEIDWEISPASLSMLFYGNDRKWDINGDLRSPLPPEIERRTMELIEALREFGGGAYLTLNGLKVYRDPEFPDSYEVYAKVGHASPRIPKEAR